MWLRLGRETRIDLTRAPLPVTPAGKSPDAQPATVPMPVALGLMGAMAAAVLFVTMGLGNRGSAAAGLRTTPWVTGAADLAPALESCLSETNAPGRAVAATDPASAFWRVMAFRSTDPARAREAEQELASKVREILASAHFLFREDKDLQASETLRRLENVLPVGVAACPILAASRFDLALLELRGSR